MFIRVFHLVERHRTIFEEHDTIASLSALWGTVHDEEGHVCDHSISGPLAMGSTGDLKPDQ
ncbi:hypothetical protein [Brevibacillus brevis]|uniref:hypothetical protein n=1 Tax=Brevibacillus brevis TaxID=1393 RepID=UPI0037C9A005